MSPLLFAIQVLSIGVSVEPVSPAGAAKVELVETAQGWRLLRNSEPYFIKGAGGRNRLEELRAAGGNSIRTWHPKNIKRTLDQAHALGLTVTLGIWLKHERHGFDYGDAARVAAQKAAARDVVLEHKDHPALLMWGIGNEMEGNGKNARVWQAVNDIARMVKELDPDHPTMTVIAGVWPTKIRQLNAYCPDIDIVGINAYGGKAGVAEEARRQGLKRPYVLTEFGPTGWWQVGKTSWGVALEPTSTRKATTYQNSYQSVVVDQPDLCLGSYAFLWGNKQEHTRTWFGLFLPEGQRTAAIDVLTRAWTGKWPDNRCPQIRAVKVRDQNEVVEPTLGFESAPGTQLAWSVDATDPDGDTLTVRWELRPESTDKKSGGDPERAPPTIPDTIKTSDGMNMTLEVPAAGAYRVFVYVLDGNQNAATANVPLLAR